MQVTYFMNGSIANLLFLCHITLDLEKVISYQKLASVLHLKLKLSGKFRCFKAINGSIKMVKNDWIFKNLKHFTGPKQWDASFSFPPDKSYLRLWNKSILCGIYRNMEAFDFPMLRECSSWVSKNGAMKMFFWHHPQNVCWKICQWVGFWLYCGS